MSIPLDKLYHYIEGLAREIRGDNILIYRFYPHGSKNINNLTQLRNYNIIETNLTPQLVCNDQEPLNYEMYKGVPRDEHKEANELYNVYNIPIVDRNLRSGSNIYDKCLLLHSEKRSAHLIKYKNMNFIPVYYWSHAIIAIDWFRYARYDCINKSNITNKFLIYNRAWSGTREYRLKFVDLLITHNLINECQLFVNPTEPELGIHYLTHTYINVAWKPIHQLEDYTNLSIADSSASADYVVEDYNTTDFEVVLETLFDDSRLHLTEKVLRPIALGQPFLLAATHGSLEYLRSYGFRTFASVIDESYDTIEDPVLRLEAIVKSMKEIATWTETERAEKIELANRIAMYNRKHFFSSKFNNLVVDELKANLETGLAEVEDTNTSKIFLNRWETLTRIQEVKEYAYAGYSKESIAQILAKAHSYYNR